MVPRAPAGLKSAGPIPLVDLKAQYRGLKAEIDRALQTVLASGQFILGPEVLAFEREAAAFCGTAHAVAVASGTDALELSLRACGVGGGDEVVTTAFSFFATAEAILAVGAVPVFIDIDPGTCNLDPALIEARLTSKTKAIIPVHLYGHPCDMAALRRLAKARDLVLIEDCAQAMGAAVGGKRVGSLGTAGALSFYPSKTLGAYGDGGMVVTNDAKLAEQIRLMRAHGSAEQYRHLILGTNSRLDELQAAILRVKLRRLDAWISARRRNASAYTAAFERAKVPVRAPIERAGCRHAFSLYTIRTPKRDAVQKALTADGISTQVAYPRTLPQQPALSKAFKGRFPNAEAAAREVLSLPLFPELSPQQIARVVAAVARALR